MLTALVFLLIITVSVSIHEFAHYLNARSVGVEVRAFSVGMGPVLWKRKWRGTEWRLSLLPLGGYVDLPGMAPKVDDEGNLHHPDEGMARKGLPAKLWILVGGGLANLLFAILLIALTIVIEPAYRSITAGVDTAAGARIESVLDRSPAQALGLEPGDVVLSLNGIREPDVVDVQQVIQQESELVFLVERAGETVTLRQSPWPTEAAGQPPMLGVTLGPTEIFDVAIPFPQALGEAFSFTFTAIPEAIGAFGRGIGSLLTGQATEELAGPVGMVGAINQATQLGVGHVLMLAALINLSLAVFNLLPIPGLDGGRMLMATIIAIRRKPFRPGQEEMVHFMGIMAVLALMLLITFNELGGIFRG